MVYTIHLEATAIGEAVRAAVVRAPRGEVALVFPLGRACVVGDADELATLAEVCAARDLLPVIIGGDEHLRAYAVAAGFAAATSLEEWETSKHPRVRPGRGPVAAAAAVSERSAWPGPAMRLMSRSQHRTTRDAEDLYTLDGEDPPGYVAELLARERAEREDHHASVPTVPLQRGRVTRVLSETARDQHEAEAVDRAQQLFEERLTAMIRQTGPLTPPNEASDPGGSENGADG